MVIVNAKRIGGSLMVRIPKELADEQGIHESDAVELVVKKVRIDLFGAFPNLKPYDKKEDRFWSKYE